MVRYAQLASFMGISYVAVVLPRLVRGKSLKANQGVMLKMVRGDLVGDLLGGKEGRRGVKIGSMSRRKSSLALEKGRFKHTGHCQAIRGVSVLTRGMRNLSICIDW